MKWFYVAICTCATIKLFLQDFFSLRPKGKRENWVKYK